MCEIAFTWLSLMVSMIASFLCFQRDVLDEILDLIESVSEGFPIYSFLEIHYKPHVMDIQK